MMTRYRSMGTVGMMTAAAVLAAAPALAGAPGVEPSKEIAMTRIHVIVGEETLSATLDDTAAGRDFAALLPLEITLADYHATEKVAALPRRLDTTGAPDSYAPKTGDITYYAPWGNLAIFYKPFRNSKGLIRLGAFDGTVDGLLRARAAPVRIEVAE